MLMDALTRLPCFARKPTSPRKLGEVQTNHFVHTAIRPEPFITDHLLLPEATSV
jgi:hypothetical protein